LAGGPEAEAAADTPDLDETVADPSLVEWSGCAPGAMPAVAQRLLAEERSPNDGVDPVRTDHDVGGHWLSTGETRSAILTRAYARRVKAHVLDRDSLQHRLL
jgi:hypothetical protein